MKYLYNVTKAAWMLNYGTKTFSPHHMNSVLVEAWDALNVSYRNIIRGRFVKKTYNSIGPRRFTTNTQACAASIPLSSGTKAE